VTCVVHAYRHLYTYLLNYLHLRLFSGFDVFNVNSRQFTVSTALHSFIRLMMKQHTVAWSRVSSQLASDEMT